MFTVFRRFTFLIAASFILVYAAHAATVTIDFDDLSYAGFSGFTQLGIENSYKGYRWGYGVFGGLSNRRFDLYFPENPTEIQPGWAVDTISKSYGSETYGWNAWGVQSLWIDFNHHVDFVDLDIRDFLWRGPTNYK